MKPKVAVVKNTGCAGCQMEFLRLVDEYALHVIGTVDITYFVMGKRENSEGPWDVTFIEGSISTPRELNELKDFRTKTKTLVALGDCASTGCIPSILNWTPPNVSRQVYQDFQAIHSKKESFQRIFPLHEYVPVDVHLRGCPPHKDTMLTVIQAAIMDVKPYLRQHPVCVECKLKENVCILVSEKRSCMGPVTNAGCGAICPTVNRVCEGCYGPMSDANASSLAKTFREDCELSDDEIVRKFRKYAGATPAFAKEAGPRYE